MKNESILERLDNKGFFSDAWWDAVLVAWNSSTDATLLAGIGTLCFELEGDSPCRTYVDWDEHGHGVRVVGGERFTPRFSGTADQWHMFLSGEVGAMAAVLTRKLRFSGSLPRVLAYVHAFDALARVARG